MVGGFASQIDIDLAISFNESAGLIKGAGAAIGSAIGALTGYGIACYADSRQNNGLGKAVFQAGAGIILGMLIGGAAGSYGADTLFGDEPVAITEQAAQAPDTLKP